jgi:hypothetical protein
MDRAGGRERAVDGFAESGGDGGSVRWALVGCRGSQWMCSPCAARSAD